MEAWIVVEEDISVSGDELNAEVARWNAVDVHAFPCRPFYFDEYYRHAGCHAERTVRAARRSSDQPSALRSVSRRPVYSCANKQPRLHLKKVDGRQRRSKFVLVDLFVVRRNLELVFAGSAEFRVDHNIPYAQVKVLSWFEGVRHAFFLAP